MVYQRQLKQRDARRRARTRDTPGGDTLASANFCRPSFCYVLVKKGRCCVSEPHGLSCGESIPPRAALNDTRRTKRSRRASAGWRHAKHTHVAAANATTPPSRDTFCSSFSAMIPCSYKPWQKLARPATVVRVRESSLLPQVAVVESKSPRANRTPDSTCSPVNRRLCGSLAVISLFSEVVGTSWCCRDALVLDAETGGHMKESHVHTPT